MTVRNMRDEAMQSRSDTELLGGMLRQLSVPNPVLPTSEPQGYDGDFNFDVDPDTPVLADSTSTRPWNPDNTGGELAWGGHTNGNIPTDELTQVGRFHLERQTAAAYEQMRKAAAKDGVALTLASGYRDYAGQVWQRENRGDQVATATPGYSNHGWGKAIDVSGSQAQQWLRDNGELFGFVWPQWAQREDSYEPWHWEYRPQEIIVDRPAEPAELNVGGLRAE